MRSYLDKQVKCPFDESHSMPEPRLIWHISRCPVRMQHIKEGKPIYHCKYFHTHIYLVEERLL